MLGSWFNGNGQASQQPVDPNDSSGVGGSVLSQWNAYASNVSDSIRLARRPPVCRTVSQHVFLHPSQKPAAVDLEAGTGAESGSAPGAMRALLNVAKAGVGRVASAGSSVKNSVSEQANAMPSRQNLAMFGLLLFGGRLLL